ncbi:PREDICTED: uncharacterized protein LOC105556652 [Vollenhovia emeryi]|uniref:uncharacterized protein LOC105556652 n=1 Tax=Vollenhovia emeryi TaxID=411798 RepID=UPI0005F54C9F|nr:PREDICTED: uncharacterized protein LOC105556652 [Vollenhovia emeryi]
MHGELHFLLEHLYYIFTYPHTRVQRYMHYALVIEILMQLTLSDMNFAIRSYVKRHFDDNPLCFYKEVHFVQFFDRVTENNAEMNEEIALRNSRILLVFIMLSPRKVLTRLMLYGISIEFEENSIFNLALIRVYYRLNKGPHNVLICILKDIIFQKRILWNNSFMISLHQALQYKVL